MPAPPPETRPAQRIEHRIIQSLAIALAFLVTTLRGVRWPNDWAEAQWMIGYQQGFIKRGLPGATLRTIRGWMGEGADAELLVRIAGMGSFIIACLVLLGLLLSAFWRSRTRRDALLFCGLMSTSTYLVMSGHVAGYYDQIAIVIVWLAMLCVLHGRVWWAGVLLALGMFSHETLLVLGIPSVLFVALLTHWSAQADANPGMRVGAFLKRFAPVYLLPGLVFLGIIAQHSLFMDTLEVHKHLALELGEYKWIENRMYKQVPWALTYSFFGFLEVQAPHFLERIFSRENLILAGLPMALGLILCGRALRGYAHPRWALLALVAFTLLPLALHAIAWDTSRIWTYPLLTVCMGYWAIHRVHDAEARATPWWLALGCVAVIGMQFFQRTELMDLKVERFTDAQRIGLYAPLMVVLLWFLWPRKVSE